MTRVVIPTFAEFTKELPEKFMTEQVVAKLKQSLSRVSEMIGNDIAYLQREGKDFDAILRCLPSTPQGSQYIADFCVRDLTKPHDPSRVNWHLQNTSQVSLNGCILFDERSFANGSDYCVSIHT